MKKVLAMAAAAALTCGVSAYAANPFSDVSAGDWAYQAVTSLSEQGVVEGYPDGTFKGQQNITRYEMAQIIARMLAKEDQYNAEQRAVIDKLASEYADELNSLGVRVSNLEKKVGNVRFTGDARMRYSQTYAAGDPIYDPNTHVKLGALSTTKNTDNWNGRIRLGMTAAVNDSTYVYGRFLSQMDFVNETDSTTSMDRLFVHHQFGNAAGVTIGRSELFMGSTGMFYDDIFDGVRANVGTEKLNLEAGYGRFKVWNANVGSYLPMYANAASLVKNNNPEAYYASLKGQIGAAVLGADYVHSAKYSLTASSGSMSSVTSTYIAKDIWGANLNIPVGGFSVFGDYYRNSLHYEAIDKPVFWTAGLAYGHTADSKPGTFRIGAQYVKADTGSYFGGTAMQVDPMALVYSYLTNDQAVMKNVKYWLATADVMLMKNVRLHGEYAFHVKGDSFADGNSTDFDDIATVSLNYSF